MNLVPSIRPLWPPILDSQYDLFLAALGFERRSRHVAEAMTPKANHKVACAFPDRKILSYLKNEEWFLSAGYKIEEVNDNNFQNWVLDTFIRTRRTGTSTHRMAIDISSMTRFRIGVILDAIRLNEMEEGEVLVDFIYNLAEFSPPPERFAPNVHVGPVSPSFAGWSTEPDQPPVAVIGLGYEESKALGALEHIQASEFWLFKPNSRIEEYNQAMLAANRSLVDSTLPANVFQYSVEKPFDCFVVLELLLSRLRHMGSPLIFPFGPKIFALCGMLVACLYDEVAVWRVSAGALEEAADRTPTNHFCGLQVLFSRRDSRLI